MEIPIHDPFRHLGVLEYLGILWPDRSRRTLEELLAAGKVRGGGEPLRGSEALGELPDLTLAVPLESVPSILSGTPREHPGSDEIRILHEDERFAVLSKPSGVPVVPDRVKAIESCLEHLVRRELSSRAQRPPGEWVRYRIVQRIDRLTSGLVIVARTPDAERRLGRDLEMRRVHKEYLALLLGDVLPARFTVDCPVAPGRKGRMRAEPPRPGRTGPRRAREATTEFQVLERFGDVTLVRALPRTGRTHQIRVHAWAAGHPLAIDPLYRVGRHATLEVTVPGMSRLTLHSHRCVLPEAWEAPRAFECPLPADFASALRLLRS